jgi:norsolorinic acid ketoreductase
VCRWINTDMGDDLSKFFGGLEPPNTLDQSIKGTMKVIDEATRAKTSGTFAFYEGGGGNPTSW